MPVSVSALAVVWGVYWILRLGFGQSLNALSESNLQFAMNLSQIGMDILVFLSFVATIAVQVITFVRMVALLGAVRVERGDA